MEEDDVIKDEFSVLFEASSEIFGKGNKLSKSYVPPRIIARDTQILDIAANLKPILSNRNPFNMFIWGGKGVGKTITINHVLETLSEGSIKRNKNITIDFFNINCNITPTDTAVCLQILSRYSSKYKMPVTKNLPTRGQSIDFYMTKIWEYINERASQCDIHAFIIFFDEIDKWNVSKKRSSGGNEENSQISLLYDFTRAIENKRIDADLRDKCFIAIIAASNKMDFLTTLEGSIRSAAGFEYLQFPDYNTNDLYQILSDRKDAFLPGVLDDDLIYYVAEFVVENYNGDARKALDILNLAGKYAERNKQSTITLENIQEADTKLAVSATTEMLLTFSKHDMYLLIAIYMLNKYDVDATTGLVYKIFKKICETVKTNVTSLGHNSRRLGELEDKQLILSDPGKRGNTRIFRVSNTVIENIDYIYPPDLRIRIQNKISDFDTVINSNVKPKKPKQKKVEEYDLTFKNGNDEKLKVQNEFPEKDVVKEEE
jgi:cell division control protein 6